jgi:hypothetical protein
MRSLPSVASATQILCDIGLSLTDPSSVQIGTFSFGDVVALSPVQFEIPFGGGLPSPTVYQCTLSTSPGWWLGNRARLTGAEARLTAFANSDNFQVHVGRIGSIATDPVDPNQFTLSIYDKLLYNDPLVPVEAIVDSWSTPHIEHLTDGYPLYYGTETTRPIVLSPVTSDCSVWLGPRNISSANHSLQNLKFWRDGGNLYSLMPLIVFPSSWMQQSGDSNCISGTALAITLASPVVVAFPGSNSLFNFGPLQNSGGNPTSAYTFAMQSIRTRGNDVAAVNSASAASFLVSQEFSLSRIDVISLSTMAVDLLSGAPGVTSNFTGLVQLYDPTLGGDYQTTGYSVVSYSLISSASARAFIRGIMSVTPGAIYADGAKFTLSIFTTSGGYTPVGLNARLYPVINLQPLSYRRYSAYVSGVGVAIAITNNPIAILDDVLSHYTSTPYRQDQSSAAQVLVQSFQFNGAYIGPERQRLSVLMDDFARTCGFNFWASDSGAVAYRVYAESAVATNSIAAVITTSDMLSFQLLTSPLGTTIFNQQGYGAFQLDWNFDYQLNKYQNTTLANKTVNALCNSAFAGGAQKTFKRQSKYVMDADAASYANGHAVRMGAQGQDYVVLTLPARYFGLELADIVNVRHPLLTGTGQLFQVTKCAPDYSTGKVMVTAGQLLSAAGT